MNRQRFSEGIVIALLLFAACKREQSGAAGSQPAETKPAEARRAESAPLHTTSYADAMQWFRSARAFRFTLREGDTRAEGSMERKTPGAEKVRFTLAGEEWLASTDKRGVVWTRGGKEVAPPTNGMRLFQRVTLAFDPQKVEGDAQLVEPDHYRFTDANTGAVHDVWVADGRITRMTIGDRFELTITP